jgi:undecaprenyl-diphosphatase
MMLVAAGPVGTLDALGLLLMLEARAAWPGLDALLLPFLGNPMLKMAPLVLPLAVVLGRRQEDESRRWAFTLRSVAGVLAAIATARALQQLLPGRPRPMVALAGLGFPYSQSSELLQDWSSMPSDHAVLACALATAAALADRRLGILAWIWALLAIGIARLHFGLHYPSDLMAGAAIGAGLMLVAHRLPRSDRALTRPIGMAVTYPGAAWALMFLFCFETMLMFQNLRGAVWIAEKLMNLGGG